MDDLYARGDDGRSPESDGKEEGGYCIKIYVGADNQVKGVAVKQERELPGDEQGGQAGAAGAPEQEAEVEMMTKVPVDSIECVSSADEYVAIHTASGSHLMRGSIRQFVERVEPGLFVRVHRRWLVRQTAISELSTRRIGRTEVVLRNGKRLPAGRVHLKQLRQTIQGIAAH